MKDEIRKLFEIYEKEATNSDLAMLIRTLKEWYFEKEGYKSRIEKAIEYITNNICDVEFMKKEYKKHLIDFEVDTTFNDIEKLLTILEGE